MPPKAVDRLRIAEFRARLKNQEWVKKVLDPVWLYLHGFRQFRLKGLGKIKSPRNTVRGPVFETPEKMWLRKPLADPRQWRFSKRQGNAAPFTTPDARSYYLKYTCNPVKTIKQLVEMLQGGQKTEIPVGLLQMAEAEERPRLSKSLYVITKQVRGIAL